MTQTCQSGTKARHAPLVLCAISFRAQPSKAAAVRATQRNQGGEPRPHHGLSPLLALHDRQHCILRKKYPARRSRYRPRPLRQATLHSLKHTLLPRCSLHHRPPPSRALRSKLVGRNCKPKEHAAQAELVSAVRASCRRRNQTRKLPSRRRRKLHASPPTRKMSKRSERTTKKNGSSRRS